jgi:hypothetical protein
MLPDQGRLKNPLCRNAKNTAANNMLSKVFISFESSWRQYSRDLATTGYH